MTKHRLEQLSSLLEEYYNDNIRLCRFDCFNCDLHVLKGYDYGHTCAIEVMIDQLDKEVYG